MGDALEIAFHPVKITDAPLRVLQHLSYYTVQYGLSVKQRTGADRKYWRELPTRLRAALDNVDGLEPILNELDNFAKGADERKKKLGDQRIRWAQKEIVMSAQLESLLAALPGRLISGAFTHITDADVLTGLEPPGGEVSRRRDIRSSIASDRWLPVDPVQRVDARHKPGGDERLKPPSLSNA